MNTERPSSSRLKRSAGSIASKLGSREMTFTSDLDLLFFYDVSESATESDGKKPLDPTVYYGRLAQRLVTALASATGEGKLYDVDTRLRRTHRADGGSHPG